MDKTYQQLCVLGISLALGGCNSFGELKATVNNNFHRVPVQVSPSISKNVIFDDLAVVDSNDVSYKVAGTVVYPKSCRTFLEIKGKMLDSKGTVLYSVYGYIQAYNKGQKSNFELLSGAGNRIFSNTIDKAVIESLECS